MRKLALLGLAAAVYAIAAWSVAPGFYDGFGPPQPYNFTCPPPQAGANQKPSGGHATVPVNGGVSEAFSAFTDDGQLVIGFLPGAFATNGNTPVTVTITPLDTCPQPSGIRFVTNAYRVTATAELHADKRANLVLRYSNLEPDPSTVYQASDPSASWTAKQTQPGQPFTVVTTTTTLGYFAAGYPSASPPPGAVTVGGGQVLPIIVAVLIVLVVLAGLPLAVMRRRGAQASRRGRRR